MVLAKLIESIYPEPNRHGRTGLYGYTTNIVDTGGTGEISFLRVALEEFCHDGIVVGQHVRELCEK
jgi:hypothetical protein